MAKVTAYMVQKVDWEYGDDFWYRPSPGESPTVKVFLDRAKAAAHARELEWAEREKEGWSFQKTSEDNLIDQSTLSADEIGERLRAVGLDAPRERGALGSWIWQFRDSTAHLTDEERETLWEVLNLSRYFEVVPVEVELEQ